jgi:hypothetical protein
MARGTKVPRAVFRALFGIPIRPVHGLDRSTYGLYIGLLRPFLRSHCARTRPLTHITRTRIRSTMLNPRFITLVGALALLLGLAALVNETLVIYL